jgi:hypothetical protein
MMDIGNLTIDTDGTVTFRIDESGSDWRLTATHLYIGDEPPAQSPPAQYPYKHKLDGAGSDVYHVDLEAADVNGDGIVYIAGLAELKAQIGVDPVTGEPIYTGETALALGERSIGRGRRRAPYAAVVLEPAV